MCMCAHLWNLWTSVSRCGDASGEQWEARLPWLKRDLATGVGLWAASLASMALCTWLYVQGTLSAPTLVIANALAMSVLHELEHDIIHSLWARGYPRVQDLLFAGIMLGKLGSSPWQRKVTTACARACACICVRVYAPLCRCL